MNDKYIIKGFSYDDFFDKYNLEETANTEDLIEFSSTNTIDDESKHIIIYKKTGLIEFCIINLEDSKKDSKVTVPIEILKFLLEHVIGVV
jgi:hypothetical protein